MKAKKTMTGEQDGYAEADAHCAAGSTPFFCLPCVRLL